MAAELSEGLRELEAEPLSRQAQWWTETARSLDPCWLLAPGLVRNEAQTWLHARMLDPRLLQGHGEVDFDILGRYFDGTTQGISFIVDRAAGKDGKLDAEAVWAVLVGHFGFLSHEPDSSTRPGYQRLWDVLLTGKQPGSEERTTTRASLLYAVRHLRIGALLDASAGCQGLEHLYHYDYSDGSISGSLLPGAGTAPGRMRGLRSVSALEPQRPCSESASAGEYLFRDPAMWQGRVHWVHAHRPGAGLLLALGQQHQLQGYTQGLLCRLQGMQPQFDCGPTCAAGTSWRTVVLPIMHLDAASCASLERYRAWFEHRSAEAKSGRLSEMPLPPCVTVGIIHLNVAVVWSSGVGSTVISVASEPCYLGRWNSIRDTSRPGWPFYMARARAACCTRRRRSRGYSLLSQREDLDPEQGAGEDPVSPSDELEREILELEESVGAAEVATFERTFRDILVQLSEDNSRLRMGTHLQLALRIILSGVSEYLDVIFLYKVAVSRLEHLLRGKGHKDDIIQRVALAKLELGALLRTIEPFMENVLPELRAKVVQIDDDDTLSVRITRHHMVDVENNTRQFLQQCRSLIQLCESLIAEYERAASDRVNNVLNFLAIITFLVMPVQILTGLYGMNFKRMPELEWHYGYPLFFVLAAFITSMFATILCCIYHAIV